MSSNLNYDGKLLTHWGRVMHICVSKLTIIGTDNGLSPDRRQALIWANAGILLIEPLGTKFSEIFIKIYTFSFRKMHLKMSSGKWWPFCLGFNVLIRMACSQVVYPTPCWCTLVSAVDQESRTLPLGVLYGLTLLLVIMPVTNCIGEVGGMCDQS